MLILKTLSHRIFRILSTALGLACFWSITGEASLVMTLFMGVVGLVFLSYGLFRNDLLDSTGSLTKYFLAKLCIQTR